MLLRGRWVEVDREGLSRLLDRWKAAEQAHAEGLPFHEALRLLSGAGVGDQTAALLGEASAENDNAEAGDAGQVRVVPGAWLAEVLDGLRSPEGLAETDPGAEPAGRAAPLPAERRALVVVPALAGPGRLPGRRHGPGQDGAGHRPAGAGPAAPTEGKRATPPPPPSLVVAPASLLANWQAELGRFAPALRVLVAHPSAIPARELARWTPPAWPRPTSC